MWDGRGVGGRKGVGVGKGVGGGIRVGVGKGWGVGWEGGWGKEGGGGEGRGWERKGGSEDFSFVISARHAEVHEAMGSDALFLPRGACTMGSVPPPCQRSMYNCVMS